MRSYEIHNQRTSRTKQRQPNRFRSQGGNRMNWRESVYFFAPSYVKIGQSKRDYPNKNANIEYYTDEKGNIRKRRKKV